MSKVERIAAGLGTLSPAERLPMRDCMEDLLEDRLRFTADFEAAIRKSERDMATGKPSCNTTLEEQITPTHSPRADI